MADSLLKGHHITPASLTFESDSENTRRNASVSSFRHVDREIDSCADSCLFQAFNYYDRSSLNCPAAQSALSPMERVSESNLPFQDCLPQQPELHFSSEIPPLAVHQPSLGFYPQLPSLVSPTTIPSMISNSLLFSNTTGMNQPARTPVAAATDHSTRIDRQQITSRSEPNLSSSSFASIVAWRRNFSFSAQGDCLQLGDGETCHPLPPLAHTHAPSSSYSSANHFSVSDSPDGLYIPEIITARRTTSAASDSGRSSPSSEFILSTSLGYALTSRGNVRPDSNIRTNLGTRPSGHRLNTSALRVLRSQSPRGSTSIRSRRISSSSRSLSPLNIGLALYHPSNDGDNLPVLLSPSDRSDRDRPPTPIAASEAGSQTLSEDSRSRFIHPGTPIQMHLPELPSLLEVTPSDQQSDASGSEIWLVPPNDATFGGSNGGTMLSTENSFTQDDEDVFGCDKERAKELLDGLESVGPDLVRRYGKVRGEDICIICRDTLLTEEEQTDRVEEVHHVHVQKNAVHINDSEDLWNLHALACLPFSSSSSASNTSIHAFPCSHLFHSTCLFPWLSIKTTCPTCRLDIDPHSLTLRIRHWFGISDNQEPTYVNVDILGRRIPWHRPPAPSLEEWIHAHETENNK